jgi:tetratricopeptide (TPR) repeat protein
VWSDQFGLWYKTANEDAPTSFRAHDFLAEAYFQAGQERMAEQEYELAMQFAPPSIMGPRMKYADKLRERGFCYPAAVHYQTIVEAQANHAGAHAALLACLLDLGRYREARHHARLGIALGWQRSAFQQALVTADSAERVAAPPGTVRVKVPSDSISVYLRVGERK